jgi:hypothetical protein
VLVKERPVGDQSSCLRFPAGSRAGRLARTTYRMRITNFFVRKRHTRRLGWRAAFSASLRDRPTCGEVNLKDCDAALRPTPPVRSALNRLAHAHRISALDRFSAAIACTRTCTVFPTGHTAIRRGPLFTNMSVSQAGECGMFSPPRCPNTNRSASNREPRSPTESRRPHPIQR